jgi:predicted amidohydrolase
VTGLRVSLLQQPLVWQDPAANRAHFEDLLAPLAGRTDLVVSPETFTTGFRRTGRNSPRTWMPTGLRSSLRPPHRSRA